MLPTIAPNLKKSDIHFSPYTVDIVHTSHVILEVQKMLNRLLSIKWFLLFYKA